MDEAFQKIEDSLLTSTKYTDNRFSSSRESHIREYTKKVEEEELIICM